MHKGRNVWDIFLQSGKNLQIIFEWKGQKDFLLPETHSNTPHQESCKNRVTHLFQNKRTPNQLCKTTTTSFCSHSKLLSVIKAFVQLEEEKHRRRGKRMEGGLVHVQILSTQLKSCYKLWNVAGCRPPDLPTGPLHPTPEPCRRLKGENQDLDGPGRSRHH